MKLVYPKRTVPSLKLIEDRGNEEIINQVLNGEISMKKAIFLLSIPKGVGRKKGNHG